ncbi:MAG: phage holin family protein [Desulfobulbaceae bacterium]|nr:phage holin family protein [Desulfobulbaceae bacterium]
MSRHISSLTDAAGRIGEMGTGYLEDRIELLALEAQEAKIRLAQVVLLVCAASVFTLFGMVLLLCAIIYMLPPEWRLYGLFGGAGASILLGFIFLFLLYRIFRTASPPFTATVQEIKKDVACFSTRN